MKIIHCGDIHLDSKLNANLDGDKRKIRKAELLSGFVNMVNFAANEKVDAIIIAGDLFDTGVVTRTTVNAVIKCIKEHPDIVFYYLKGNHDDNNPLYGCEEEYENLKIFGESWTSYREGNVVITGVELTKDNSAFVHNSLLLKQDDINIVVMHGQISWHKESADEIISLNAFKNKYIDYMALGHIHYYTFEQLDARGDWAYCGCLEGRGFDECGEHGFIILDIDEEQKCVSHRFVAWGSRKLYEIEADISQCQDSMDCIRTIRRAADNAGADKDDLVKVILKGEVGEIEYNTDYILNELNDEYFFIKIYDKTRVKIDINKYSSDISLKGEFIRIIMSDASISEEEKSEIIRTGLLALAGEEF